MAADGGVGAAGAAALTVGGDVLVRAAPTGLAWFRTRFFGRVILTVGPARAGKTCFIEYLRHGVLANPDAVVRTTTETETAYTTFMVALGEQKTLELSVREIIDTAGEQGPTEHAKQLSFLRPHLLVIILPLDKSSRSGSEISSWLDRFCDKITDVVQDDKRAASRLTSVFVLLNKRDQVDEDSFNKRRTQVSNIIQKQFPRTRNIRGEHISILPSVLIQSTCERGRADDVVKAIAGEIARTQRTSRRR